MASSDWDPKAAPKLTQSSKAIPLRACKSALRRLRIPHRICDRDQPKEIASSPGLLGTHSQGGFVDLLFSMGSKVGHGSPC